MDISAKFGFNKFYIRKYSGLNNKIILLIFVVLFPPLCLAANTSDSSDAFYQLFNKMQSLLQGGLGVSLALSSFVLGVFGSAFSHRLMPAAAGAGVALLVQYGPPIVIRLTGAVI